MLHPIAACPTNGPQQLSALTPCSHVTRRNVFSEASRGVTFIADSLACASAAASQLRRVPCDTCMVAARRSWAVHCSAHLLARARCVHALGLVNSSKKKPFAVRLPEHGSAFFLALSSSCQYGAVSVTNRWHHARPAACKAAFFHGRLRSV